MMSIMGTPTPLGPTSLVDVAADILRRHGVNVLLVLYLVYQLSTVYAAEMRSMHEELKLHVVMSSFYSRQICINTATTIVQQLNCEPPKER